MSMSSEETLNRKLQELWTKYRHLSLARLDAIERAIEAVNKGSLTEQLRAQAAREAHKLAGSLGTFGMQASSLSAREIEDFFAGDEPLSRKNAEAINRRFDRLKREIESR